MSFIMRCLLIIVSLLTFIYITHNLKKSRIQVMDATYWILVSFFLLILSIFPGFASNLSMILGIESPINFVFLSIIFILLVHEFRVSIKLSKLEDKNKEFIEEIAVREKLQKEEEQS